MRVTCSSMGDFAANLEAVASDAIYLGVVWFNVDRNPVGGSIVKATSWEVSVRAGCVVLDGKGGEYILEAAEYCGIDRTVSPLSNEGSERVRLYREALVNICSNRGWTVRPGEVHE